MKAVRKRIYEETEAVKETKLIWEKSTAVRWFESSQDFLGNADLGNGVFPSILDPFSTNRFDYFVCQFDWPPIRHFLSNHSRNLEVE